MRASRITNRRWALSAFGTASAAALCELRHRLQRHAALPRRRRLLMSIGGAIAGGRAARARHRFDPATFWEEVRRYGVTVATYTWTSLHDLVEAPPQPGERHHPVRLFIGSGMPRGLWRRVQRRFAPARVLEFYAATETGAILINVSGSKIGRDGPAAARQRRGAGRRLRPAAARADPAPRRLHPGVRRRRGRDAAGADPAQRRRPAPRRCAGCSPATTRGSPPATCSAATATGTSGGSTTPRRVCQHRGRPGLHRADSRRARRPSRRRSRGRLRRAPAAGPSTSWPSRRSRCATAGARRPGHRRARWRSASRTRGRRSSTSSTRSRSRPGTGRSPAPLREQGIPEPDRTARSGCLDESRERYRPLTATARQAAPALGAHRLAVRPRAVAKP